MIELCGCTRGTYDEEHFSSCYQCFLERRAEYLQCIWCGQWHSPNYGTCYGCRAADPYRQETGAHLRRMVLARDQFRCRYCGSDKNLQVDHIKPCAKGGTADPWNLQTLCGECNRWNGATWWDGCRHDRARQVSLEAYATYLWEYLTPDEQARLWAELSDWLVLDQPAEAMAGGRDRDRHGASAIPSQDRRTHERPKADHR